MTLQEKIETLRQLGFEVWTESELEFHGEKYSGLDKDKIIRMVVKHPSFTGETIMWNNQIELPIKNIIENLIEDIVDEAKETCYSRW